MEALPSLLAAAPGAAAPPSVPAHFPAGLAFPLAFPTAAPFFPSAMAAAAAAAPQAPSGVSKPMVRKMSTEDVAGLDWVAQAETQAAKAPSAKPTLGHGAAKPPTP